ncbi:MAG TPA: hypothetical protein VN806_13730, partial [Caulobacteraceae bacterium]|nr:hypothetical protein [Caulobacteraceae bacterium]
MTRNRIIAAVVAVLVVAGIAFLVLTRGHGDEDQSQDVSPTALVTTAPVRSQALQDVATVYGVVQADPAATSTLAAPRAEIVTNVLVRS